MHKKHTEPEKLEVLEDDCLQMFINKDCILIKANDKRENKDFKGAFALHYKQIDKLIKELFQAKHHFLHSEDIRPMRLEG